MIFTFGICALVSLRWSILTVKCLAQAADLTGGSASGMDLAHPGANGSLRHSQCQRVCWHFRSNPDSIPSALLTSCRIERVIVSWDPLQHFLRTLDHWRPHARGVCWFLFCFIFLKQNPEVLKWDRHCLVSTGDVLWCSLEGEYWGRLPKRQSDSVINSDNKAPFGVQASEKEAVSC